MVTGKNGSGQEQQQRTVAKEVVIQFKCQACYKMFDEMEQLDEHENQCSMSLIDEVEMQDERIHMGEKPCSDTQCDKELSDPMDLKEHEKAKNPKSPKQRGKEFSCMACDKKFPDFNSLSEHDHDHTGEKPFGCTKCNKKFANLVVLKRHKQNHGEQRKSLRLGSFNIGGGLISSKKKRGKEELLLETLSTNKVDIACVQETELEHFDESRPFSLDRKSVV